MIVELRTYDLKPGTLPAYSKLYQAEALPIQTKYLGTPLGWYFTDIGPLNQFVHLWAYQDLNDRAERRGRMTQDPVWQAFLVKGLPMLDRMESKILIAQAFFDLDRHVAKVRAG